MKLILFSAAAIYFAGLGSCANGFKISNFDARAASSGPNTIAFFNVAYGSTDGGTDTSKDVCYSSHVGKNLTALSDVAEGSCRDQAYAWSLKKQPGGRYKFFIGIADSGGSTIIPKSALGTYKGVDALQVKDYQKLDPKDFFVCDVNGGPCDS